MKSLNSQPITKHMLTYMTVFLQKQLDLMISQLN